MSDEAQNVEAGYAIPPAPKSEEGMKMYTAIQSRVFNSNRLDGGYDVWRWPEFIEFAKRLGIDLNLPTRGIVIRMYEGEAVSITQEYLADDIDQRDATTPFDHVAKIKRKIDITTVHNEAFKTAMPMKRALGIEVPGPHNPPKGDKPREVG